MTKPKQKKKKRQQPRQLILIKPIFEVLAERHAAASQEKFRLAQSPQIRANSIILIISSYINLLLMLTLLIMGMPLLRVFLGLTFDPWYLLPFAPMAWVYPMFYLTLPLLRRVLIGAFTYKDARGSYSWVDILVLISYSLCAILIIIVSIQLVGYIYTLTTPDTGMPDITELTPTPDE